MSAIKVNDLVKVVSCESYLDLFKDRTGKVTRIFETLTVPVAIVELEDGSTIKVPVNNLDKVEVKPQESEIPEGAKRITEAEFREAVAQVTSHFAARRGDIMLGMTGLMVGADIGRKLFGSQDSVVMTKDEFIVNLWDGCSPVNVSESVNGKMTLDQSLPVAISAIHSMRDLANTIFDESDHD